MFSSSETPRKVALLIENIKYLFREEPALLDKISFDEESIGTLRFVNIITNKINLFF